MFRFLYGCAVALGLATLNPVDAKVLDAERAKQWEFEPKSFACPLTGTRFEQVVTHPHYPIESFPDGSHLGDEWIDTQIPECPDDGVPILPDYSAPPDNGANGSGRLSYRSYTADELARLSELIASDAWASLLDDTRHLRSYWLAKQLDRPAMDRFNLLLHSPWGAENDAQRTKALETLVADLPGVLDELDVPPEYRVFGNYHAVDAMRQLGRFDEASAFLDTLDALPVDAEPGEDPDNEYSRGAYSAQQRRAIEMQDSDRFAIEALDDRMAGRLCSGEDYWALRGPNAERACQVRAERLAREQAESDAVYVLLEDRDALSARCTTLPADADDPILTEACRRAQHDLDWDAGERLAKEQPTELAEICERVPEHERDTVQTSACGWYESMIAEAVKDLLLADEAAFDRLCDTATMLGNGVLSQGCNGAGQVHDYRQATALWQDKPALRAICRDKKALEDAFDGRHMACQAIEDGKQSPYWLEFTEDSASEPSPLYLAALPHAKSLVAAAMAQRTR
ncbi:hypothetical protein [Parerythrobacter lacustris]|uniref:Uncharacterized protein n=1 Tax=Parerythrobacter lacustris TaxID=2969984 RepID=A0ABT1XS84_9SPHN|nr:hypothetical protein [Parerythrobacter lacustris]MCR2834514.1 hypothetical protein [Parerythrobacter lacustris]